MWLLLHVDHTHSPLVPRLWMEEEITQEKCNKAASRYERKLHLGDIMNPLLGHEFPLESWLIPKLCPISWAITYTEVNPVLG